MMNPFDLTGKHLLITGASSGIGRATALVCSQLGAVLTITGRNEQRLNETLQTLEGDKDHVAITCDLNNEELLDNFVSNVQKLDGVVFCAGTQETCVAKMLNKEVLNNVFDTNFFSTVKLSTLLLTKKKINKSASLVFVSSIAASKVAEFGNAAYSASKGAISSYSRVLALELSARRIRVNTVIPGMVKTPLMAKFDVTEEQFKENELKYPFGYGEPEDVANAIAFLLSDGSKWITGTELLLDGGLTLQ